MLVTRLKLPKRLKSRMERLVKAEECYHAFLKDLLGVAGVRTRDTPTKDDPVAPIALGTTASRLRN